MIKTPLLIDIPKTGLSRYQKLKAFKKLHEIETHHCKDDGETSWLACHMPSARRIGYGITALSTLYDIVSEIGRLTDEAGVTDYGKTEREAVRRVCENVGIPCEL